jgi:hypothetical protein
MLSLELKRYYEPLRLPSAATTISLPYTQWAVVSPPPQTGLQHWAVNLPEHAIPATPGVDECHFRYSSTLPTAFPFCPQGRLLQFVYEATHRFTCVTACSLAVGKLTTPCRHSAASSGYRGVRTTPQTGLQPARLTAVAANGQTTVSTAAQPTAGKLCNECGNLTMIRKDGCDFCTACGAVGTCG